VAWTEAPSSIGDLWRQRYRWCYGTLQATWKHRRALVEGRAIGLVGLPYALVYQVGLAVLAPAVDAVALVGLLTGGAWPILAAWLAFTSVQVLLGVVAFRLDGERLTPLWVVPLQQVFYRQLMYLVVIQSAVTALVGARLRWQAPVRTGQAAALTAGADRAVRVRTPQPEALRDLLVARGARVALDGPGQLTVTGATTEQVGQAAAAGGVVLHEMRFERSNLEDVFLELTASRGERP